MIKMKRIATMTKKKEKRRTPLMIQRVVKTLKR